MNSSRRDGVLVLVATVPAVALSGSFNYDSKFSGATAKPLESLKEDGELVKNGFSLNHARVLVQKLMKRAGMLFGH
ncbi:unnamed protein product [Linum tenue]|uniref:Uncharacterized protein n=1 Tax=Linum tenue TaxID=586396 RepID=A0AAV0NSF0_9ROSI|nr:unnamed protein product [Linum tenue]